jgi:4-amino-4-deoxy-L-arabinose transferase-like glycosyltransferase
MSLTANMVWTETLFIAAATAALLVFVNARESRAGLAVAGVLAGAATMIRPNGVVIVALMLAWLFLAWWCDPSRRRGFSSVALPAGMIVGALRWSPRCGSCTSIASPGAGACRTPTARRKVRRTPRWPAD